MKAYINDPGRAVFVATDDVRLAYALGSRFTSDHPDLEAWALYPIPIPSTPLAAHLYRREEVKGLDTLAQAIRKGPKCTHSCPRHPKQEATG